MERCPNPRPDCTEETPFADDHHVYWPACEYTTPLEKRFRKLEINIVRGLCRCLHKEEHTFPPPQKPSPEFMKEMVDNHG